MIPTLTTKNLILSLPSLEDLPSIIDFDNRNINHLEQWESKSLPDEAKSKLESWVKECEEGKSARFFIRPVDNPSKIIGFCHFTQIFHGSFQACYLGIKIDHEYEGKGLMFEALEASIKYVFESLKIHRIMANYMPINKRSEKLLQRLGFVVEGYAKNYLLINGQWEDHTLTSLTSEQWQKKQEAMSSMDKPSLGLKLDSVTFREFQISDAEALSLLMKQLGYPIDVMVMQKNIQQYISLANQKAWVAEKSGQIIGCIAVAITRYFHRPGSFLRVIALIIDEQHRRLGIGKTFMNMAENFAKDSGCSHIELTSGMHRTDMGSHEFYQTLGYNVLNEKKKYFAKKL